MMFDVLVLLFVKGEEKPASVGGENPTLRRDPIRRRIR